MPVKRKITEPDGVYFITLTCHQWLPLIEKTNGYDLVYNCPSDWWSGRGLIIYKVRVTLLTAMLSCLIICMLWLHSVIQASPLIQLLEMPKGLWHMKLLNAWRGKKNWTIATVKFTVEAKDRERNKKHEVWEDSFDWKECRTHKFMKQKLDYMPARPVRRAR